MDIDFLVPPEIDDGGLVDGGEIIGGDSVTSKDYTELITTSNILVNVNNVLLVLEFRLFCFNFIFF